MKRQFLYTILYIALLQPSVAAAQSQYDWQKSFLYAINLAEGGFASAASMEFLKIVSRCDDLGLNRESYFQLGLLTHAKGNDNLAFKYWNRALGLDPDQTLYDRIISAYFFDYSFENSGEKEAFIEWFTEAVNLLNTDPANTSLQVALQGRLTGLEESFLDNPLYLRLTEPKRIIYAYPGSIDVENAYLETTLKDFEKDFPESDLVLHSYIRAIRRQRQYEFGN